MGSKSKQHLMKSYKTYQSEADSKHSNLSLNQPKMTCKRDKENALDIVSKSLLKNIKKDYPKGSGSCLLWELIPYLSSEKINLLIFNIKINSD